MMSCILWEHCSEDCSTRLLRVTHLTHDFQQALCCNLAPYALAELVLGSTHGTCSDGGRPEQLVCSKFEFIELYESSSTIFQSIIRLVPHMGSPVVDL